MRGYTHPLFLRENGSVLFLPLLFRNDIGIGGGIAYDDAGSGLEDGVVDDVQVDVADADVVQLQRPRRQLLERVDVDLVTGPGDGDRGGLGADLQDVFAPGEHGPPVHPDDGGERSGVPIDNCGKLLAAPDERPNPLPKRKFRG